MSKILETLRSESDSVEAELAVAQERVRLVSDKVELIRKLMALYQVESNAETPAATRAAGFQMSNEAAEPMTSSPIDQEPEPVETTESPYKATFRGFKGLVATRT